MKKKKKIHDIVLPIREELEAEVAAETSEFMGDRITAVGKCDVYAEKVADALISQDMDADVIYGEFDSKTHFWTECGKLIVDITVDQFGSYLPRILIGTYKEFPQYRR
jgi:hypothetical protein